ncbi:mitogen-activated protein kinase kinase kinase [Malassezia sp. CBS 17886]|nr:mitogen-activated protein kinase kinase kinase [Malassezia sp. CBS 17886]
MAHDLVSVSSSSGLLYANGAHAPGAPLTAVRAWSQQEVAQWLHECHLEQYITLFTESDIHGAVLLQLDPAVMKEMGITSMGDRLRMHAAIRSLHKRAKECAAPASQSGWPRVPAKPAMSSPVCEAASPAYAGTPLLAAAPAIAAGEASSRSPVSAQPTVAQLHTARGAPGRGAVGFGSDADPFRSSLRHDTESPSPTVWPMHSPLRRPNTATGAGSSRPATSGSVSATFAAAAQGRLRRPTTSSTTVANQVGYQVGRGAFAAPAAKPRVGAISAPYNLRRGDSDSDQGERPLSSTTAAAGLPDAPSQGAAQSLRKRTVIKFIHEDGTSRTIDVSDCYTGGEVLIRVLRKFGLPLAAAASGASPWAVAMTDMDQHTHLPYVGARRPKKVLSESELMAVCSAPHVYLPVWQHGLFLQRADGQRARGDASASPRSAGFPGRITRRASTFSVLSGLGVESVPPGVDAAAAPSPTLRARGRGDTGMTGPLPGVRRRVRNFFGHRPPPELISSHLADYFPTTDSRELQRHSRRSFADMLHPGRHTGAGLTVLSPPGTPASAAPDAAQPPTDTHDEDTVFLPRVRDMRESAPASAAASAAASAERPRTDHDSASLVTMDEVSQVLEQRRGGEHASIIVDQDGVPIPMPSPCAAPVSSASAVEDNAAAAAVARDAPAAPCAAPAGDVGISSSAWDTAAVLTAAARIRWHKGALIGAGSFGNVFLGMNAKTGLLMAVKQVQLPSRDNETTQRQRYMVESLESEIELLKTIEHPHIVQYLDSFADGDFLNIFLEYVPGGSVVALLRSYGAFEEPLVQNFVRQILYGLRFLHARGIIHRDIKGANILVDNKGGVKISDFGISKKVESGACVLQGSVYWMAPEVVKQTAYTYKADVWSLGCLVVEMFSASHPWPHLDQMQALFQIGMSKRPDLPEDISAIASSFLQRALEVDVEQRPNAEALLEHPLLVDGEQEGG